MKSTTKTVFETTNRFHFFCRLRAARGLRRRQQLYLVLQAFKENCAHRYCKGSEIFREVYSDPTGTEYWRGWLGNASLTVEEFTNLLATHADAEYVNRLGEEKTYHTFEVYTDKIRKIISTLRDAAELRCLDFKGELDVLLRWGDSHKVSSGELRITNAPGYRPINTFDDVEINPRQTVKWFTECPERAELLPESLRSWWVTQSTLENTVGMAQDETSAVESTTREKPALDPKQPYFCDTGECWQVTFQEKSILFKRIKGLDMIAFLVSRPWKYFEPEALLRLNCNAREALQEWVGDGYSETVRPQPKADYKALKAAKEELEELNNNPLSDPEEHTQKIEILRDYIRENEGLTGRRRNFPDNKERARCAVSKDIHRAMDKIKKCFPELHQHLTQAILGQVQRWSYHPLQFSTQNN